MEIRQLEYFMAVCKTLHFTRASEELGVTQPTLSHQIKALEDEIGTLLFDRIGKKTALTEAGSILLKHCHTVFNSLASARNEIQELQQMKQGRLSIGALTGEINQLVSALLLDFHQDYPHIKLRIVNADDLIERVVQNEIDFAVTILPVHDERVTAVPLYEEELYLAVSNRHPIAHKETVRLEEIAQFPFILFPENYNCRRQIDAACQVNGICLQPFIETDAPESIINLVENQAGVSILSETLLNLWNRAEITMIKIEDPSVRRQIGLVYHKEKYLGFAAREFMGLLKKAAEKHSMPGK